MRSGINMVKAYGGLFDDRIFKFLVVKLWIRGVNCQLSDSELTAVKLPLSCPLLSFSILVVNCL